MLSTGRACLLRLLFPSPWESVAFGFVGWVRFLKSYRSEKRAPVSEKRGVRKDRRESKKGLGQKENRRVWGQKKESQFDKCSNDYL